MTVEIKWRAFLTLRGLTLPLIVSLLLTTCARQDKNSPRAVAGESTNVLGNKIPDVAQAILEHAQQFELLSLDPSSQEGSPKGSFHGYKILGKTVVKDATTQRRLVSAFERGVAENTGVALACFNPRHGVSVKSGERSADFVICFECRQVQVSGAVEGEFLVGASPQSLFDQVLRDASASLLDRERRD